MEATRRARPAPSRPWRSRVPDDDARRARHDARETGGRGRGGGGKEELHGDDHRDRAAARGRFLPPALRRRLCSRWRWRRRRLRPQPSFAGGPLPRDTPRSSPTTAPCTPCASLRCGACHSGAGAASELHLLREGPLQPRQTASRRAPTTAASCGTRRPLGPGARGWTQFPTVKVLDASGAVAGEQVGLLQVRRHHKGGKYRVLYGLPLSVGRHRQHAATVLPSSPSPLW